MSVRPLGQDDLEQLSRLNQLAFGYRSTEPLTDSRGSYGLDGPDGRLLAVAKVGAYEQWWGGRRVPMGGIAGVAVHPDGRGRGMAAELMRAVLPVMREAGQCISVLFPTGLGIYRPLGWEVVGSLDDTRIATRDLEPRKQVPAVRVRTAGDGDVEAVGRLYAGLGPTSNGLLTRDGPEFPAGPVAVLGHDVVALAETSDGAPLGYTSYDRGKGYREGSELRVWECVAQEAGAMSALLASIASWSSVASNVLWRGRIDELALQVRGAVPPPTRVQPWMVRIVDAPAAVAARGFASGVAVDVTFRLEDPDIPEHEGGWRLQVADGRGSLERVDPTADLPRLHVRGLALLYAGAAGSALLIRAGLLDRPVPGLDSAFAGQAPVIADYF